MTEPNTPADPPRRDRPVRPLAVPPTPSTVVPPALSPLMVGRHRDPKATDSDFEALVASVAHAQGQAEEILDLRARLAADGSRNETDRALVLANQAPAVAGRGAEAIDRAIDRAEQAVEKLAKTIAAPPPVPGMNLDTEIRNRLASLPLQNRRDAIRSAIADGDDAVIGAVLRGPALLTGLDHAELEALRTSWQSKARPAEFARLRRLRAAIADTETAGRALVTLAEGFTKAPGIDVAMERRAAADAAIARSKA